jgi:hypothetical protein
MVDYGKALKRPFSEINKFIIAILISIVPIVNFIFAGYSLEVARTAMKHNFKLPEWKNIRSLFLKGLLITIIIFLYAVPVLVLGILILILFVALLVMIQKSAGWLIVVILALIFLILFVIAITMWGIYMFGVILRYAETKKFSAAFEFRYICKKAFRSKFIWALSIMFLIGWLISFVAQIAITSFMLPFAFGSNPANTILWLISILISVLLSTIVSTYVSIFMHTGLGEAYAEK